MSYQMHIPISPMELQSLWREQMAVEPALANPVVQAAFARMVEVDGGETAMTERVELTSALAIMRLSFRRAVLDVVGFSAATDQYLQSVRGTLLELTHRLRYQELYAPSAYDDM